MMRILNVFIFFFISILSIAQPPLSKRDQIKKAEFEAQIEAEKKYEETLSAADKLFKQKEYVKARMAFEEARQYNPAEEQWLASKVNDLDILMARNAARAVDSVEVEQVANDLPTIKDEVPTAPVIAEVVELPVEDVEIEEIIEIVEAEPVVKPAPQESPAVQTQTVSSKNIQLQPKAAATVNIDKPAPAKAEKVKEDFGYFDEGITEESFTMPNHTVLRIVVKEGIDVKVFKRVKHAWGGEFFFLDEMDVTRRYWEEQVALYREKYPE